MKKESVFETASMYLAAFLHAKDIPLVDIKRNTSTKKCRFIFRSSERALVLFHEFQYADKHHDDLRIDVRVIYDSLRYVKERLYQA